MQPGAQPPSSTQRQLPPQPRTNCTALYPAPITPHHHHRQVGASNELPESEELDALYDRFLLRRRVAQVRRQAVLPHMLTWHAEHAARQ